MEVTVPDTSAAPGETVTVPIQIGNLAEADSVLSYGFELGFDESKLSYEGFEEEGTLSEAAGFTVNDNPDSLTIGGFGAQTSLNEVADGGEGTMLKVRLSVVTQDTATVTLDSLQFNSGNIPADPPQPSFEVAAENRPPSAALDSYQATEDSVLSVTDPANGVLANDTDPEGDSLTASLVSGVSSGTLTLDGDGTFEYTPDPGFTGTDQFTYEAADGNGGTDQATVTLEVLPAENVPPAASDDNYQTPKNNALSVEAPGVLGNDTDANGDTLSASLVSDVSSGTLTLEDDGSFEYTPDAGFTGTDSFDYAASDGEVADTAEVEIEVENTAPVAAGDSYQTSEDSTLSVEAPGVLGNDTDENGDALTASVVEGPASGSLSLEADGSFEYDPEAGFFGEDSFVYEASDGDGGTDQATVTITVEPAANVPPVAAPDGYQTFADSTLSVEAPGVLGNDTDENGDPLSAELVSGVSEGTLTLEADGSFEYTPNAGFTGTDSFDYAASDGEAADTAEVEIEVLPSEPPVEVTVSDTSAAPGETVTVPIEIGNLEAAAGVLSYGFELGFDESKLSYEGFEEAGTLSEAAGFTINENADIPRIGGFGAQTTLNEVADGGEGTMLKVRLSVVAQDTATVALDSLQFNSGNIPADPPQPSFEIAAENRPPSATPDSYQATEDSVLSVTDPANGVLANDTDPEGDSLTASLVSGVSSGTLTLDGDGTFEYTPDAGFTGTDQFTYEAADGNGGADQATVTIEVQPGANVPPVAGPDSYQTPKNSALSVEAPGVLGNDTDANGDTLSASLVSDVSEGTLTLDPDGSFEYTPDSSFTGTDTFSYRAVDDSSVADTAEVEIEVENTAPVAAGDSYQTSEDSTLSVEAPGVLGNDTDENGDALTASVVEGPASGSLTLDADGSFEYDPEAGFFGEDSFVYEASDGDGGTDQATVTITVEPAANVPPVAAPDDYQTFSDSTLSVEAPGVLGNDTDENGDALTASVVEGPASGSLSLEADGSFEYTPDAGFTGTDSFDYAASDGEAADTAEVEIEVLPSEPPVEVTVSDTSAAPGETVTVPIEIGNLEAAAGVLSYGFELGFDESKLSYEGFEEAGTLSEAAGFTINENADIPRIGGFGAQTTLNEVADGGAGTMLKVRLSVVAQDTATVTLDSLQFNAGDIPADPPQPSFEIEGGNLLPEAAPDSYQATEDSALSVTDPANGVLANDTDPDGDALTASVVSDVSDGTLTLDGDGTFEYTPDPGFTGTDQFTYEAADGNGGTDQATATIDVNARPVANDTSDQTIEQSAVTTAVLSNDTDPDGDGLDPATVAVQSGPENGTATANSDGTITYTPDGATQSSFEDSYTYTVEDSAGAESNEATVTITVDEAPVANGDSAGTDQGEPVTTDVLANDSDDDGLVPSTVQVQSGPSDGTVTNNGDGTLTYAPDSSFFGADTFTYTVEDAGGNVSNEATVTVTVNGRPVASDTSDQTIEQQPTTTAVLANDTDPDGDGLDSATVAVQSPPEQGTATANSDGTITYTPDGATQSSFEDSYTYTVEDSAGAESNEATVTITVDEAPAVADDSAGTDQGEPVTIDVLANDSDDDGLEPSTVTVQSGPSDGAVTNNGDGTLTYAPDSSFFGADTFTYTVEDTGGNESAEATVTVVVNGVPTASDDSFSTDEDQALTVSAPGVLENDSDPDGDSLAASLVSGVSSGTLTLGADGSLEYTPDSDFNGTDGFVYASADPSGAADTAAVTLTVEPVNDPPTATDDNYATVEDSVLAVTNPTEGVLANDSDIDGDPLAASVVDGPSNGTLTFDANGTFEYTPDAGFADTTDTFVYEAADGNGGTDQATVSIAVAPAGNNPPVAAADSFGTAEGQPLDIGAPGVLDNDSDPDGDSLTASVVEAPPNGALTLDGDGSFTYTPDAGFNGTDTFVYEAGDGNGATDQAEVTITVEAVNDPPVAEADEYETPEDQTLSVTQAGDGVLGNDTDPDGDSLTASVVSGVSNGTLTLNDDGTFDYEPDPDFNGDDEFTYEVSDGATADTATATLTVVPINDPPVAEDTSFVTEGGTTLTVDAPGVLGNDTDPDADSLTASRLTGTSNGTLTLDADGSLEYTPDAGFSGTDSFFYAVADTAGSSGETGGPSREAADQAEVTITVEEPDNAPPVAEADEYETPEDQTLSVTQAGDGVLGNDTDPDGDALTASVVSDVSNGTLTLNDDGTFDYTPDTNFNGDDEFTYEVSDGATADTATATLTVVPVNDPPVASADSFGTPAGQPLTVEAPGVLENDTDPDADSLTASRLTGTSNGTLTLNADGSLEYTPDAGFSGTDSFFYAVADTAGSSGETGGPSREAADQAEVIITVEADNAPPAAAADAYDTPEDQTLSVTQVGTGVLGNDTDPDGDALTASVVDSTENGTLTLNDDGTFDYTPDTNFNGDDEFTYEVSDGNGGTAQATATLTVVPVNDPPVAVVDTFVMDDMDGDTLTIDAPGALTSDTDPDGDSLTASRVTGVPNGTLTLDADGSFEYIPDDGFTGTDRFFYLAKDGNGEQDLARTVIEVEGSASEGLQPADQVTAVQDNYDAAQGNTRIVDSPGVLGNDAGAAFVEEVVSGPENGTLDMPTGETDGDGSFEYTPADGFKGEDSFRYVASDEAGEDTDTTEVFIDVGFVNTPPVAEADTFDTPEDDTLTVPAPGVLANDFDPDGDTTLVADKQTDASNGTVTLDEDGSLEYVPEPNFNGVDNLTYTASETNSGPSQMAADNAEIQITVTPVNDPPSAETDEYEMPEDQTLSVTQPGSGVLGNDTDLDGDTLTVESLVDSTESGALTLNEDGTFTYEPDTNFNGTDEFRYEVSDDSSASDIATVDIEVVPVNDPPVAEADSFSTAEDSTLAVEAPGVLGNDLDPDEDSLRVSVLTGPSNGTLDTLAADGSLEYVPNANFNGEDSFEYEVSDGNGEADQATAEITVTPVNDPPVAAADTFETLEGQTLSVDAPGVLGNDEDIDAGDSIAVAGVVAPPENGTLDTLNADGSFTYEPESNAGSDSFTYRVVDNAGGADTSTVTIDVVGVNDPPVAVADTFETAEDEPLGLDVEAGFGNDTDPDGDSLRVSILTGPSNGTLDTLATDSLAYVPNPDFNGSDAFNYEVSDGNGATDNAAIQITVTPVNDPPSVTSTISDTTLSLSPAESTTGPLPFTIADVDDPVDSLAVSATTSDSTVVPPDSVFLAGSGAERTVTVNPANVNGASTITVAVEDSSGAVDSTAFEVVKNAIENAPPEVVVEIPDATLLTPGPPLQLTGLTGTVFSDPDGDSLDVSATSDNENVLTVSGEGAVLNLLPAGQVGNSDVTVTASDGQANVSTTFNVEVDERQGEPRPASRARSFVSPSANSVGFGDTGVGANFQGVEEGEGGTVEASFFPDTTSGSASPGQAFVAADTADSFEFVSRYQWKITNVANEGVTFDSVDVAFSLEKSDVVGITEPDSVTIIKGSEEGGFEAVPTTFVEADSALAGEGVESFSTFKFASNDSDNPLPVELTDFTVRRDEESALVQWHTATETNNAGFEVQHQGPSAEAYTEAGFVESKAEGGTTAEPKSYRYEVTGLVPGTHQFRLRQVDIDGTGHLSKTVSVTVEMEEALRLTPPAPNPVRASAQLQFGLREAGEATITLYNMLGQRVATLYKGRPTPGEMQRVRLGSRQLSQLSSGVYFVRLRAHGKTRTQRLVRVR